MSLVSAPVFGSADIIERSDFWRRSPASAGGALGHKEWSYFCVLDEEVQLVLIFSIMDRASLGGVAAARVEEARVTMVARGADKKWCGQVDLCDPAVVAIRAGRVDARLGSSSLSFTEGLYRVHAHLGDGALISTLALKPAARPAVTRSVPLGRTDPMYWFVVPRLHATGELRIGDRVHVFNGSPAYHDHNWGRFAWGDDFSWEWGIALSSPSSPSWSLIYYRITDRGRHAVLAQGVLLWQGNRHARTFRDGDLSVRSHGRLRSAGCLRLPGIMHLAIAGSAGDLPRRLEIAARGGTDALDVALEIDDCAQISLPHDHDDGITTISECHARATVAGRVNGGDVRFACPSTVEFNRGAA